MKDRTGRNTFEKHLEWASSVVEGWPDWKQGLLRSPLDDNKGENKRVKKTRER